MDHVESSSHKYEHTNGDNKSLLSQALEKSGSRDEREERDSVSDDDRDSEERAGSASIDTIKSDMNSRDCEPPTTPIFPPGLEALYRQAGFPPFLGLGGQHHGGGLAGPSVTHVGLQSHAANPTGKERASKSSINKNIKSVPPIKCILDPFEVSLACTKDQPRIDLPYFLNGLSSKI